MPCGRAESCGHRVEDTRRHSELVERDGASAVIEQAEHDALAVHRRHGRHAQIELARLESHANAPVLRAATLRDVELREQLDARHDRVMQMARRLRAPE